MFIDENEFENAACKMAFCIGLNVLSESLIMLINMGMKVNEAHEQFLQIYHIQSYFQQVKRVEIQLSH